MRRVLVRLHRWIGLALAAYVLLIGLTGSVLVYRPELYRHFEPAPVGVPIGPALLSDQALLQAAGRAFPATRPIEVWRGAEPNEAVEVVFEQGGQRSNYLFDPYTGDPVGPTLSLGFRATAFLLDLHTELVGGETGRAVNGALALGLVFMALSGVLVWTRRRQRERSGSLRRLHLTVGIWAAVFVLMWGITGIHLAFPALTAGVVERVAPFDETSLEPWIGDTISYWLSYPHFGRFGGVLPGCGRGEWCDEGLKIAWALIGLAPVFLATSGVILWLRRRRARARVRRLG